ncbi:RNase A-like domain-containing protein [Mycobacteroides chelonae]|uniref:RNase A-like domain-containing protein n=1 Tax=Mycobacteroides chelonae TaxID=1774 RepID=UPI0013F4BDFF|nr:RNase A-like domain-containing protein [Mycobacteroides chelonae]
MAAAIGLPIITPDPAPGTGSMMAIARADCPPDCGGGPGNGGMPSGPPGGGTEFVPPSMPAMPSYEPGRGRPPFDQNNGISIYNSAAPQPSQAAQPSHAPVQNQDGSYTRAANGEQQPVNYNNAPNNQQLNSDWQNLSNQLNQQQNQPAQQQQPTQNNGQQDQTQNNQQDKKQTCESVQASVSDQFPNLLEYTEEEISQAQQRQEQVDRDDEERQRNGQPRIAQSYSGPLYSEEHAAQIVKYYQAIEKAIKAAGLKCSTTNASGPTNASAEFREDGDGPDAENDLSKKIDELTGCKKTGLPVNPDSVMGLPIGAYLSGEQFPALNAPGVNQQRIVDRYGNLLGVLTYKGDGIPRSESDMDRAARLNGPYGPMYGYIKDNDGRAHNFDACGHDTDFLTDIPNQLDGLLQFVNFFYPIVDAYNGINSWQDATTGERINTALNIVGLIPLGRTVGWVAKIGERAYRVVRPAEDIAQKVSNIPLGSLAANEALGGHTLLKHIAQTDEELFARVVREGVTGASTFANATDAERFISDVISANPFLIDDWLKGPGNNPLGLNGYFIETTGRTVTRGQATARNVSGVRVVLQKSSSSPVGYIILTAYPQ